MANIYARWIKNGKKTIAEVPERWQDETRKVLKEKYGIEV